MIKYYIKEDEQGETVRIEGVANQDEFVKAEHQYLVDKYKKSIAEIKPKFWLRPFTKEMAEIGLPDGTKEIITFIFPKFGEKDQSSSI